MICFHATFAHTVGYFAVCEIALATQTGDVELTFKRTPGVPSKLRYQKAKQN